MMACRPTSLSCNCNEGDGETVLRPAVPMKSPMKLMSGLRSFALDDAPPKVCVWVTWPGSGTGAAEDKLADGDGAGSISGCMCEAASRMRSPDGELTPGSGVFASRRD